MFFEGKSEGPADFVQPRVFRRRDLISPDGIQLQIEDEGNVQFMQPERFSTGARPQADDDETDKLCFQLYLEKAVEQLKDNDDWKELTEEQKSNIMRENRGTMKENYDTSIKDSSDLLKAVAALLSANPIAEARFSGSTRPSGSTSVQEAPPEILDTGAVIAAMPGEKATDKIEGVDPVEDEGVDPVEDEPESDQEDALDTIVLSQALSSKNKLPEIK